tara:strand:+ start:1350 stop:1976 length:627 start_codon:yes stop_codon:yes gene_type:complete
MATISTDGIASGSLIYPEHVLRSIDALNGVAGPFDIVLSGSLSLSGSFNLLSGSLLPNQNPIAYLTYNTSSGTLNYASGSLIATTAATASSIVSGLTASFADRASSSSIADTISLLATASISDLSTSASIAEKSVTASYVPSTTGLKSHSGSLSITGSLFVTASHVLNLAPSNPLPTSGIILGSFGVTGSDLAYYNGISWKKVSTEDF